jgi:hypothetical protein
MGRQCRESRYACATQGRVCLNPKTEIDMAKGQLRSGREPKKPKADKNKKKAKAAASLLSAPTPQRKPVPSLKGK